MEVSLSECDSESNARINRQKCYINNDVQQLTQTDFRANIYVQTNNNHNHNHKHIECIQLDDSEDELPATPQKRVKLSHSPSLQSIQSIPSLPSPKPSPLPSLPSLPPQPSLPSLASTQPCDTLVAHSPQHIQCNSKCKSEKLEEHTRETNNTNNIDIRDISNSNNGREHNDVHNNGECKPLIVNTSKLNINGSKALLNDKMTKCEQLIKRLISICVEKRFDAQIQRLNSEQNMVKRVKILKKESADRDIELKLIKRANKMKTPTVFTDIGIQTNFNENKITDNDVNGSESCDEIFIIE